MAFRHALKKSAAFLVGLLLLGGSSWAAVPVEVWPPVTPAGATLLTVPGSSNKYEYSFADGTHAFCYWRYNKAPVTGALVYSREWAMTAGPWIAETPENAPFYNTFLTVKEEVFPAGDLAHPAIQYFSIETEKTFVDADKDGVPDWAESDVPPEAPSFAWPTGMLVHNGPAYGPGTNSAGVSLCFEFGSSRCKVARVLGGSSWSFNPTDGHETSNLAGTWWGGLSELKPWMVGRGVSASDADKITANIAGWVGDTSKPPIEPQTVAPPTTQPVKPPAPGPGYVTRATVPPGGTAEDRDHDGWDDDLESHLGSNPMNGSDNPGAFSGRIDGPGGMVGGDQSEKKDGEPDKWTPPKTGSADLDGARAKLTGSLSKWKPNVRIGVGGANLGWSFQLMGQTINCTLAPGVIGSSVALVRLAIDWCLRFILVVMIWRTLRQY